MRTYTSDELKKVLEDHRKWIFGEGGQRANLSGADLSGADLSGADLSGANLYRADLSRANLSGSNLYRAKLFGADLSGSDLSGADLSRADLSRANLSGSNLYRAKLFGSNLSGSLHGWAQVAFAGHGEMGRMLTAIQLKDGDPITYQCGCIMGDEKVLLDYIERGDERMKPSRMLAFETVKNLIAVPHYSVITEEKASAA